MKYKDLSTKLIGKTIVDVKVVMHKYYEELLSITLVLSDHSSIRIYNGVNDEEKIEARYNDPQLP